MIALGAAELAAITGGTLDAVGPDVRVAGPAVIDSREAVPGALFVALPGERTDGHDFAAAAVEAGASLVLASRPTGAPSVIVPDVEKALGALAREHLARLRPGGLRVVGVTGSVGKTTTKDLLLQVLGASGPTVAPVASFNNEIGLPLTVLRADAETRFLVLEMGAAALGELDYLTGIAAPDVAVVLRVAHAHVGGFGGIDAVARAKSEIVQGLVPGGVAVLNADDDRVAPMAALAERAVLFGESAGAQVRAADLTVDAAGRAAFTLETAAGSAPVHLSLVGAHHVTNALAAASVALELGVPLAEVARRVSEAGALSAHRMHVVERADGVTVIDDSYNANPDSMRAALQALAVIAGRQRRSVAVLGEMLELGDEHRSAHDAIGRFVVRLNVGLTVVVGPGARPILDAAGHEGSWGDEAVGVDTVADAIDFLEGALRPGDVVLVKSSHGAGLWQVADALTGVGA
ncbi:MAG: UDP-N-acetylmuramoyl-tripeptide--D-alanyl-D-alanine ligase [Actinomycetales bacterium]|nr:UDP-N-acetylmuramoyl-tripeptide--D-alanyl-D-alanine ligase [Actinomycetales bacterium]